MYKLVCLLEYRLEFVAVAVAMTVVALGHFCQRCLSCLKVVESYVFLFPSCVVVELEVGNSRSIWRFKQVLDVDCDLSDLHVQVWACFVLDFFKLPMRLVSFAAEAPRGTCFYVVTCNMLIDYLQQFC